jgi:hypothetical protein
MQQIPPDLRGMAQAQGNDALLSQVLPAGISRRFDMAGGSGNMVAFWGDCHSSLHPVYGETGTIKVKPAACFSISGSDPDSNPRHCSPR